MRGGEFRRDRAEAESGTIRGESSFATWQVSGDFPPLLFIPRKSVLRKLICRVSIPLKGRRQSGGSSGKV